ncbi:MAG: phosphoglucosamine mutase [Candidatus Micrarchaeota archaeon]|nr:phosphoglucosamine mutase [Candidatus Micrarchaeota archaeon]
MFGTSGIRGIFGKEVTPELAMRVGNAIGAAGGRIVVAMDTRPTSPLLCEALSAGAMLAGCGLVNAGIAPTPLLAYASMKENCTGAMITASHNPPEYNGIKLFFSGAEYTRQQEKAVEEAVAGQARAAEWKMVGQKCARDYSSEYISFVVSKVDAPSIRAKRPRVLVDAGNAAAYRIGPAALEAAGCEVVRFNCDSPGKFVRNLEPNPSTLGQTAKQVVWQKCDFGVAFDGDGDRAIAIDEKGNVLPLDVQLSLFCSHFLKKDGNRRIVSTVEASLCVRETVESLGGTIYITPVGSLHVAQEVARQNAVFGGEPCGEYIFPSATPCAEGVLSALFIAEIFATQGRLSSLASMVKTHPMERRKYRCDEAKKHKIMEILNQKPQLEGSLTRTDGLRYDFADGWVLIRPSGTEPAIRLTCEATSQKRLGEVVQRAERLIMQAIDSA